jgi:LacI family transcriptional regulator
MNLRQLAAAAGVSAATASRALRNDSQASRKTCERIQKLAAELGYKPNPLVTALMANRVRNKRASDQEVIAFLNSFPVKGEWRKYPTFVDYFEGARERAAEFGYRLEEFWLREPAMDSKKMSAILFNRGIRGVLLAPTLSGLGHLSLEWERFSVAALGYSLARPHVHRAVHDNFAAIRMMFRHLERLGYRRIGLAMNLGQDRRSNDAWTAGFAEHAYLQRPANRVRPFLFTRNASEDGKFHRWLKKERPGAVVAGSSFILKWMRTAGLEAPKDVGFVLLDRPLTGSDCSGVYFNGPAIGAAAIDQIIGQINRNERGLPELPKTTMINGRWMPGETLRVQ